MLEPEEIPTRLRFTEPEQRPSQHARRGPSL
ncbi:hypothetical protein BN12_30064 [Nostocoides japonicum T1-X7]|uniref:Uncharacterized protein n=1 Tax=Nostocoides japonicum T1-X7 TaxID=1194083 RepID=A0A077LXA2_9MICO|nr:hypothetical protein BN12_30064 [Tetrasphaera japonica T1-X7]